MFLHHVLTGMDSPLLTGMKTSPSSVKMLAVGDIVRANWGVRTSLQHTPIHPVDFSRGYEAIVFKLSLLTHVFLIQLLVFFLSFFFGATDPHQLILEPEAAPTTTGWWSAASGLPRQCARNTTRWFFQGTLLSPAPQWSIALRVLCQSHGHKMSPWFLAKILADATWKSSLSAH